MSCKIILIIVFLLATNSIFGLESLSTVDFIHFKELHNTPVYCLTQDKTGYIWVGTENGLYRYDSRNFTLFKHQEEDSTSLSDDAIYDLFIDSRDQLWIGTRLGVNLYLPGENCFERIKIPHNKYPFVIRSINEDSEGTLWFGTLKEGIVSLEAKSKELKQEFFQSFQDEKIDRINTIQTYRFSDFIIGTNNGLYIFDPQKKMVQRIDSSANLHVRAIVKDHENLWYIGTENQGLYTYRPKFGIAKLNDNSIGKEIDYIKTIRTLFVDIDNSLWIGSRDGLYVYTPGQTQKNASINQINTNSVRDILEDKNGDVWLGYYYNGLDLYHKRTGTFNYVPSDKVQAVNSIIEDNELNIWMGSANNGISIFDQNMNPKNKEISNAINAIIGNKIKSLLFHEGKILIGTEQSGLFQYNIKSGSIEKHPLSNALSADGIYKMLEDRTGGIWLSCIGTGLNYLQKGAKQVARYGVSAESSDANIHLINESNINDLAIDMYDVVWAGSVKGLLFKKPDEDNFQRVENKTLSSLNISSLHISNNRFLWVGTLGQGIFQFDIETKKVIQYITDNGLCNNYISGILSDESGFVWTSTYKGLSKINYLTGEIMNFYNSNELKDDEFQPGYLHTSRGQIVLSALNGFVYFNPKKIESKTQYMPVIIQELRYYAPNTSKPVAIHRDGKNENSEITLKFNQSFLSVDFVALNFLSQNNTNYAYKIENLHDWINIKNQNSIFLSNLSSGNYTIRVKATDSNGNWSEKDTSLVLKILPPFYMTKYAYIIYLMLLISIIYSIFRFISAKSKKQLEFENETREKERIKEINEFRTRFFTNISHEFRTPLTLIIEPSRILKQELKNQPKLKQNIDIVFENANRLLNLTNQILEFRKTESNKVPLKLTDIEIIQLTQRLARYFLNIANSKSIQFSINIPFQNYYTCIDTDKFEKILNNLLSNAFKYTPEGGRIQLNFTAMYEPVDFIQISISNTGNLIPKEMLNSIFTRFMQLNEDNTSNIPGTGIGLALTKELVTIHGGDIWAESSEENGNCFTFRIPAPILTREAIAELNERNLVIEQQEAVASTQKGLSETTAGKPMIVLVEDNVDLRRFLRTNLMEKYEIKTAEDGLAGLLKVRKHMPDLVISDIMMPEKNGFELCNELKKDILTSHIPIILLTAKTDPVDKIEGYDLGADDYIEKPFDINILMHRIDNIVRNNQHLRAIYNKNILINHSEYLTNQKDEEFIHLVNSFIEKNITNQELSINMLCDELGFNQAVLYKKIKSLTNLSIIDFIRSVRLRKSIDLLKDKQYNVSEVAYLVGFNDPKYFSKCFKLQFNQTPSEYVKVNMKIK